MLKLPNGLQGLIEADVSDLDLIRNGRHYDALKAQNDLAFYLTHAQAASGPVLEIGCGTGRVTLALAAAGVNVIGLDVSAPMLEEARRKAERQGLNIRWIEADGRTFDLGQRFALIIMPFNTLQFFRDITALQQLFHRVKSHLQDRGQFIFDVFNPQVSFLAADPSARYERARYPDPEGRGEVVLEETREYVAERQVVRSTRYYHLGGKRDVSVSSLELRCFFPCELDLILEHFDFRLEAKYGDFDNSPLSDRSPKQICICSRASIAG
jgi:SAM-dependent methyltransferase